MLIYSWLYNDLNNVFYCYHIIKKVIKIHFNSIDMIKAELSKFGLKKVILKTPTKLISRGLHKNRYETVKKY